MAKKKKRIAVVTSDCHLQERAWHARTTLCGDSYHAFEYIVDYACEHKLPIIAAGDLIDKQKNESRTPGFLRRMMERCEEAEVGFLYVQGQHELQDQPWLGELSNWPFHLHGEVDKARAHHVWWGIDWTPATDVRARLDEVPEDVAILVMHQVCHEFMGGIAQAELYWEMVPGHVKVLIVGDFHEKHERLIRQNEAGNDMVVLSPGSTCLQSITEPVAKKCFVLYDDYSTESVKIPSRKYIRPPDLDNGEDLDGFCEAAIQQIKLTTTAAEDDGLPDELVKPIIYIRYSFQVPDAYKRIAKAVGDNAHLFTKELRPKTEEQVVARAERKKSIEGGLVGALPIVAKEGTDRFNISKLLLESRNPRKVLAELREDRLG